jgi:hypothetical protein
MTQTPASEIEILDEDFMVTAKYFAAQMFGKKKEDLFNDLKHEYEENGNLNSLVFLFAQQRTNHQLTIAGLSYITNNKLAQEIIAWVGFTGPSTPRRLTAHLTFLGLPIPTWITETLDGSDNNEVVPMDVQCKLVYQAITAPPMTTEVT